MEDAQEVVVGEAVVLSKFEGDPAPENEFERIEIVDGVIVQHNNVENGQVTTPVEGSTIVGTDIGTLMAKGVE